MPCSAQLWPQWHWYGDSKPLHSQPLRLHRQLQQQGAKYRRFLLLSPDFIVDNRGQVRTRRRSAPLVLLLRMRAREGVFVSRCAPLAAASAVV